MKVGKSGSGMDVVRAQYPDKFVDEERAFRNIHRGDRIFIGTACGEPQYLVRSLIDYVESHPSAFYDAEVFHVWTLGVAPYTDDKFKRNFRHNSFFIGNDTRGAVNKGAADYTPIFLSQVPGLFRKGIVPVDVALVQASPPDENGFMSLGVSVDIVMAAVEMAHFVIVQANSHMPRVHGHTFINVRDVDYVIPHDEPLLTYREDMSNDIAQHIGVHVARVIKDGDTIQVGYGSIPNAILANMMGKKHLGVHTELLSNGLMELIKAGVVDNSRKTLNKGKTVGSFCMGSPELYEFLDDNPGIEMRPVDYTNNPLVISRIENMVAINSALEIDLTGQATAESLGKQFYSGIGGQADFMRGVAVAPGGRTILTLQSTAEDGETSRIVPFLKEGAGATLTRGDVHYVVTEYGIAYLHGKNIRQRAMDLIAIAHPKFRPWLIQEAKKLNFIYPDQAYIPGKKGEYPEELEAYRTTPSGLNLFFRSVRISDEQILKDFFYSLSDKSIYRRFISVRKDMPHARLQEFCVIDHSREVVVLAIVQEEEKETVVGVGQYGIADDLHTAEVAFVVRDERQGKGIGQELLSYMTLLARRQGLLGFTAEVLVENRPMLHLFEKQGFDISKRSDSGVWELKMGFKS